MPHDQVFPVSFRSRRNPDELRVYEREREWCQHYGLSVQDAQRVFDARPGILVAGANPDATADRLDLGTDQMCTFFHLDNHFDTVLYDRPRQAAAFVKHMVAIVHGVSPQSASGGPTAAMFGDMWRVTRQGMSQSWVRRASRGWETYFWGNLAEASARRQRTLLDSLEAYLRVRRWSIGVQPVLDLAERLGGFEVPAELFHHPDYQRLCELAAELVLLSNDVVSLEKEEARGDPFNSVTLLRARAQLSRPAAIEAVLALIRGRADEFHTVQDRLPALCDALELSPTQREAALQGAETAHLWLGGFYTWQPDTPRYTDVSRPGFARDLRLWL